eukprot:769295-Pelagomonas_calceolata.AAC.2
MQAGMPPRMCQTSLPPLKHPPGVGARLQGQPPCSHSMTHAGWHPGAAVACPEQRELFLMCCCLFSMGAACRDWCCLSEEWFLVRVDDLSLIHI